MNKEEAVAFMIDSLNIDNRTIALSSGMTDSAYEEFWTKTLPSVEVLVSKLYDRMKDQNLLA